MAKFPLYFLIILLFAASAYALEFPKLTNYVTDNANVIDDSYESEINSKLSKIELNTTVEIAVVTVESLQGSDIETFAVELFKKAGIGKKDINNGLLILVAPNEHKYRIEVG